MESGVGKNKHQGRRGATEQSRVNEQKLVMNALWLENSIEFLPITPA